MEELNLKSKCDVEYLITPKIEVLEKLDITYEHEDKNNVIIKEELPNISLDQDLNGQHVDINRPVKTEFSFGQLTKQSELFKCGNVSDTNVCTGHIRADVKQEQPSVTSVHAACTFTSVPTQLSSNDENNKQTKEAKILKRAEMFKNNDLHNKSIQKPFSCQVCDYKCVDKKSLVRHERIHNGQKPYTCHFCDYKCSTNGSLVIHLRIHSGHKPYSCKYCDYKCISNNYLVSHERTHTGQKPYSCELCGYKGTLKSHLVRHAKTHTGEKPHSCQFCDYKCATNSHLVRHMKTHTRGKS